MEVIYKTISPDFITKEWFLYISQISHDSHEMIFNPVGIWFYLPKNAGTISSIPPTACWNSWGRHGLRPAKHSERSRFIVWSGQTLIKATLSAMVSASFSSVQLSIQLCSAFYSALFSFLFSSERTRKQHVRRPPAAFSCTRMLLTIIQLIA